MKLKSMFLSGAAALALGGFSSPAAFAADPIKLGLIEDISGDLATFGIPKLHGSLWRWTKSTKRAASWGVQSR